MLPLMIDMAAKSVNEIFVEHLVRIIPRCKKNYSQELLSILDDIRYPYTESLICLALGFVGNEDIIPLMLEKYNELKEQSLYSDDNYEQGPVYALWQLKERFYKK